MDDRVAAAQLASLLLAGGGAAAVAGARARKAPAALSPRHAQAHSSEARPLPLRGARAALAVAAVRAAGAAGLRAAGAGAAAPVVRSKRRIRNRLPLARFAQWAWASFKLAGAGRGAGHAGRGCARLRAAHRAAGRPLRWAADVVSLGYAVPGAVIAVGILLPLGWLQQRWPAIGTAARWSPARCSA